MGDNMHFRDSAPYLRGYLKISVEGLSLEKFLNLCSQKGLYIWNVRRSNYAKLTAFIGAGDFKRLPQITRKNKCRVKIIDKTGLPFFMFRFHKRTVLLYGVLVFAAILYFLSTRLWQIEISETAGITRQDVIGELSKIGIEQGMAIKDIDHGYLENELVIRYGDVSWAGVQIRGTRLIIQFIKRKNAPQMVDKESPCNIVAGKPGMVTGIYPFNGSAEIKAGDTVKKGALLISGIIDIENAGIKLVHAMGRVEARCWYQAFGTVSIDKCTFVKTGKSVKRRYVKAFGKELFKITKDVPFDEFTVEKKVESIIGRDLNNPIEFIEETIWEVVSIPLNDRKWYKGFALQKAEVELGKMMGYDAKIIDKSIKYYIIEDSGIGERLLKAEIKVETLEDIGVELMINK